MTKIRPVAVFDCVVFGATGDLTLRKLLPALYYRFRDGQMPPDSRIIGAARSQLSDDDFRAARRQGACKSTSEKPIRMPTSISASWRNCTTSPSTPRRPTRTGAASAPCWTPDPRPGVLPRHLARPLRSDLPRARRQRPGHRRIPASCWKSRSATILASAHAIIDEVGKVFSEAQTFRIDHYLGKETVQNLMALRFANTIFERLWTADVIDHVQITVAETVGLEGRGGYYDKSGALRDMVQNHMLQLLCLIAMEPPVSLDADRVRDEKLKVLRALKPMAPHEVAGPDRARPVHRRARSTASRCPATRPISAPTRRPAPRRFVALKAEVRIMALGRRAVLPAHRQAAARESVRKSSSSSDRPPFSIFPPDAARVAVPTP